MSFHLQGDWVNAKAENLEAGIRVQRGMGVTKNLGWGPKLFPF